MALAAALGSAECRFVLQYIWEQNLGTDLVSDRLIEGVR